MGGIIAARICHVAEPMPRPQQSGFRPSHPTLSQLTHPRGTMHRPTRGDATAEAFADGVKTFGTADKDKNALEIRRPTTPERMMPWSLYFFCAIERQEFA
ncbi:hypothetical protein DQ04_06631020 [Trypanosoma grayi]|uniref:hypothetical protein n=1 Tax=Trypanosoma grayi TaxID=71804 RepID=UPI0004F47869|nr:hypothetical protein DQ04_06631020 [Trypanosoma grayi]KEG08691.1 hypothetical protein DQ04_06631020 [Trypanosoma grayi]